MNARAMLFVGATLLSVSATAVDAQTAAAKPKTGTAPTVVVRDAWSRPALKGGTGVVYMVIENSGATVMNLSSVSSPASKAVEMHQSVQHESNTMMHPMTDIPIPARGKYALTPGDAHLMLIGLQKQLIVGDTVPFTLKFSGGATVKAAAIVRKP